ncbi:leucyl aminopeptidase family protein [Marinifilum caeruleilacunae]|uniref:Probable cytosol aminopeptidase n=1 Tax=Marinifilum caeruleilacunae TaxID=2499076 RepID=A0ABX1X0D1_9BACT|nr:leucyl aminopeptidase [Marinifilum caeruleilacunae]NOU61621.1 leucyl aminopeptidase [Marinifilum caeruleilacunae]
MKINLLSPNISVDTKDVCYLSNKENYKNLPLAENEIQYLAQQVENEASLIEINQYTRKVFVHVSSVDELGYKDYEKMRKVGNSLHAKIQESKISELVFVDHRLNKEVILPVLEGLSLSNYQFIKYLKDTKKVKHCLNQVNIQSDILEQNDVDELQAVCEAVKHARDLVNEPLSYLTAQKLSEEVKKMADESGFCVEVFEKTKIQSLKMGGLLAVNQGSIDEPTFSILEWKPENAKNSNPIIFVGKGIVYDTGGLSLKPTKDSMDLMKSDMGGAASVAGALYAIAKAKLPVHVIGLIPATDNRPGGNAYAPGDIIKMYNGLSVEVLNTDAEGRLILADALSYAKQYKPEFVIDLATLTGAAAVAIGKYGVVAMGNDDSQDKMEQLKKSGNMTYERVVEFPFWEEYGELIKSDIADLKNIGGRDGGAITAGKFLEHFTDYPWVHIDIAGPAFLGAPDNYRGKGGTGVGVRLLFDFVKNYQS